LKAIEAIGSFCRLKVFEVLAFPDTVDALISCICNEDLLHKSVDALCEGIKCSLFSDILKSSKIEYAIKFMDDNVKNSIRKIIEFIGTKLYEYFLELKNQSDSSLCQSMAELATNLAMNFNIFILEGSDHAKVLIKFLNECTSHKSKKVSYITFDFWSPFETQLLDQDILGKMQQAENDFIVNGYIELFKIVHEKIKLKSLKLTNSKDSNFEEDDDVIDPNRQEMTLREYRKASEDIFVSCVKVIKGLKGEDALRSFFESFVPSITEEYIT